jgi:hypothetical protein
MQTTNTFSNLDENWFACGYSDIHPGKFENSIEYCLKMTNNNCSHCNVISFIICSWCKESYCFDHFLHVFIIVTILLNKKLILERLQQILIFLMFIYQV